VVPFRSVIRDAASRRAHLAALILQFRERARSLPFKLADSRTAIQPLIVGANAAAVGLSEALMKRGFSGPATPPPTVPQGPARLRVSWSAAHAIADVDALADALAALAPEFAATESRGSPPGRP